MGNTIPNSMVAIAPEPVDSKEPVFKTLAPYRSSSPRPPTPPLPPVRRVRYRLPFTISISTYNENVPASDEQIQAALGLCLFKGVWQPYLEAAMEEAWLLAVNEGKDAEKDEIISCPTDLGTKCLLVVVEKTEQYGFYQGFVTWKGRAVSLTHLQDVLDWHIGDRMSTYEFSPLNGISEWSACIEIEALSSE